MEPAKLDEVFEDLEIRDEQVTSNECWDADDDLPDGVYPDLNLSGEQVTSNECYDVEEE